MSGAPVPRVLRPALSAVVDRLVAGDFEGLKRDGTDPDPDRDLGLWIRDYRPSLGDDGRPGASLVPLPDAAWDTAEVIAERAGPPPVWEVVVDLWTAEEGRSDLSMEAEVTETADGYRIVVRDVRVM